MMSEQETLDRASSLCKQCNCLDYCFCEPEMCACARDQILSCSFLSKADEVTKLDREDRKDNSPNCTWLVTSRLDRTRSTCRAHAFCLCRACRTAWLDTLVTTSSTGSTRRTCRVVSRREVTSQVQFGLICITCDGESPFSFFTVFTG